ncbi:lysylphosphatidylglycerol synthase transmembrane domain-containing protein [Pedococcus bigeumensis]|uniref:lysylphosphatidylglycerol synthase transmembrane domain-containing protein n=1 Tax=Pedococcus bigeumensis TaxID=433644 RepID=UPI001F4F3614|nr:lysylphosphatidylglycerol synthase transmembrane domain-containing protein [Pedococcus bigeumensis]
MPTKTRGDHLSRAAGHLTRVVRRVGGSPVVRHLGGAAVLGVLVWRLGVGPSARAVGAIDARALLVAVALAALTTVCCAWRWSLVARGIGVAVPLRGAVAACYRSTFLNTATPGGVLGDVHRGVRHGRQHGDTGRGVRSVVWERTAGQVVQAVMALAALTVLPSPLRHHMGWVWCAVAAGVPGLLLVWHRTGSTSTGRAASIARAMFVELREGALARRTWPLVAVASALAVTGHVLTFLVAARTAGATAPLGRLVPLAFVVLIGMGVPMNIAGWGPREGVAAWAFGAAGLGAQAGLSTAVVYGVLVLVASLPGAGVVILTSLRRDRTGVGTGTPTLTPTLAPTLAPARPSAPGRVGTAALDLGEAARA